MRIAFRDGHLGGEPGPVRRGGRHVRPEQTGGEALASPFRGHAEREEGRRSRAVRRPRDGGADDRRALDGHGRPEPIGQTGARSGRARRRGRPAR